MTFFLSPGTGGNKYWVWLDYIDKSATWINNGIELWIAKIVFL
jgi:hypothetical protein